jgi:hypothetical protein
MRISAIAATAMLTGVAVAALATTSDAAHRGGPSFGSRSVARTVQRPTVSHRSQATSRRTVHHETHRKHVVSSKKVISSKKDVSSHIAKGGHIVKGGKKEISSSHILKGGRTLRNLPITKAVAGTAHLKGKIAVPHGIHPKLTLTHRPALKFKARFIPFVQRHWRRPFFWVAIAGIGYLTIPEFYYDDFYSCIGVDDPDYDDCLYILSYAALDEEEVVRVSMPPDATYRYRAKTAVTQDCQACRWDRYVERKWNQSYGWVKVPEIGNVTVPDAYYDRFHRFASANPPDFPQACQVLQDAASTEGEAEGARISMPPGAEYRYQADAAPHRQCTSCTLAPFVDRKWNRAYVWVQVPQTGNVTVPEDAYDRFYSYASAEPANYEAACKVLTEAAAEDTVMTSSLDTSAPE